MEKEKKYVAGWWLWILLLVVVSFMVLGTLNMFGLFGRTVGERIIFENSYQKHSADKAKRNRLEAELMGIDSRLRGNVSETIRANLEAQRSAVLFQLNAME